MSLLTGTRIAVYLLLWPEDGFIRRENVHGVFDGSTFYKKAEEHQKKQETAQKEGKHSLIARYHWVASSLLGMVSSIVLSPYIMASEIGTMVKDLLCTHT
jgi:Caleosin related protein